MQLYCISGDNCFLSRSSFIVFVSQIIRLPRNPAKLPENPRVGGSIPPLATIIHKAFSFLVVSIFSFGEHMVNIISPLVPLNILQKKSLFPVQGLAVLGAGQAAQPRCRY